MLQRSKEREKERRKGGGMDLPAGGMGVLGESRRGPNTELGLGLEWERRPSLSAGNHPRPTVTTRIVDAAHALPPSPA